MEKNKVYLIGNAHIDPVWQWRWQEGFQEIKATFRSVLDRMNEFPNFKFTCAGSMYYEWIEQNEPKMFEEIQARVKEGRWCIAGGWYLQPDCNIPSGESFARHGLAAQKYFLEKFGRYATVGYNMDSFGHNGGLPQILKKSGLKYYVFMRPDKYEKTIPSSLFIWKGADGTTVPTYRLSIAYCLKTIEDIKKIKDLATDENIDEMAFYGVGNHGGGPTIKLLEETDGLIETDDTYSYGTVDEYFENAEKRGEIKSAKEVSGDLQYHAKGCYSLNTMIKKLNRESENSLIRAEVFSSLAHFAVSAGFPSDEIEKAWKKLFFCQFHDNLAGTIIRQAADDMRNFYGYVLTETAEKTNFALCKMSWQIDTLQGNSPAIFREDSFYPFVHEKLGSPVVVFNSLPYASKQVVRIYPKCSLVTDYDNNVLPSQVVRGFQTDGKDNIFNTLICVEVPAFGYKTLKIFKEKTAEINNPFVIGNDYIETPFVKVAFDLKKGGIKSIYDKKKNRELLSDSTFVGVYDDSAYDAWAHQIYSFDKKIGKFEGKEMHITECGPVRASMRMTSVFGQNTIRQDFYVYADRAEIDVTARVTMRDEHRIVRFGFPLNIGETPEVIAENAFGYIKRTCDNGEYPCGSWFAAYDGDNGATICNDGKYSFSADKNVCYLTTQRTAIYLDHWANVAGTRDEFCDFIDTDTNEFNYRISPFNGVTDAARAASEINNPFVTVNETFHDGSLPTSLQGINVSENNVIVTAYKEAKDKNGYILRAYECSGMKTAVTIELLVQNVKIETEFSPFEVKTFRITDDEKYIETDLKEDELSI